MFDYSNLEDTNKKWSTVLKQHIKEMLTDPTKGVFVLVKFQMWDNPLCYNIHGIPGWGPGGFDASPIKQENDSDFVNNSFDRTTAITKIVKNYELAFANLGGLMYVEYLPQTYEQTFLDEIPKRATRTFPQMLLLMTQYANAAQDNDINLVCRDILSYINFNDVKADLLAWYQSGGNWQNLPDSVDRWLWYLMTDNDGNFDRGV